MKLACIIVDEFALTETTCEYMNMFDAKTAFAKSAEKCDIFACINR